MLMVVNLDPLFPHDDTVVLDLAMLGMPAHRPFTAYDELTGAVYTWAGPSAYVRLDPMQAAHVFSLRQIDAALLDPSQAELLGGPADGL
jgi:starch synthase (maltosyl-transferring)